MKLYTVIILIGIVLNYINYLVATLLNFVNLKSANYEKVKDYFSYLDFKKMALYAQARSRAEIVSVFLCVFALLAFWLFAGFKTLDDFVRTLPRYFILEGSVYVIVFFSYLVLLNSAYDIYINFYLDKKYRVSRLSVSEFLIVNTKKYLLYYAMALVISITLFTSYILYDENFWWIVWIVATIIIVLYTYYYPSLYLRYLNKVNNAVSPEIRDKILEFCERIDFPISQINIFESSRRTNRINAMFAGFGKNKSIILSDNLINNFTTDEILAVIGHEAGHYKLNHHLHKMFYRIFSTGILLFLLNYFANDFTIFKSFYVYNISFYVGIVLYCVLLSTSIIYILPFINSKLRKMERAADTFSLSHTKNKEAYISALKKVAVRNLYNPVPHKYYVFFYYNRIPTIDRIHYVENYEL